MEVIAGDVAGGERSVECGVGIEAAPIVLRADRSELSVEVDVPLPDRRPPLDVGRLCRAARRKSRGQPRFKAMVEGEGEAG